MAGDQNTTVDDPELESGDLSRAFSGINAKKMAAEQLAQNAQQGVTALGTAQQAGMQRLQAESGLASNRDLQLGGGGSGAGMRQAALSRGVAEAGATSANAMELNAARQLAGQAQMGAADVGIEAANQQQKLHQAQVTQAQAPQAAAADMAKMYQDMNSGNTLYNSKQNYNDVIAKAQAQYGAAAATNPAIKAELDNFVAGMEKARDNK